VDDTLALVRDHSDATDLLTTLNEAHPSIQFTMEAATNDRLPFIGMEIIKIDHRLETCVYRKKTNKGLLLHFESHVDSRYKRVTSENYARPCKTLVVYIVLGKALKIVTFSSQDITSLFSRRRSLSENIHG